MGLSLIDARVSYEVPGRIMRVLDFVLRLNDTDVAALSPTVFEILSESSMTHRQGRSEGVASAPSLLCLIPFVELQSSRIQNGYPCPAVVLAQR